MKTQLNLERAGLVLLSYYLYSTLGFAWWWYLVFFFAPDISMIGYFAGPKIGAFAYNLIHNKGTAVALFLLGIFIASPILQATGAIMLGHAAFDRIFGYGLKLPDDFKHTHLGMIGEG